MAKTPQQTRNPIQTRWWYELGGDDEQALSSSLFTYFEELQRRSTDRLTSNLENLRLYGAPYASPFIAGSAYGAGMKATVSGNAARVTISLVQTCIDTLTSKLAMQEVRAQFITSGGDFAAQMLSEQLQSFADGVCYETDTDDVSLRAFVDSGIFGSGFIHDFETDDHKIGIERVFPYEIFVDDADALYGTPQNLYRVKYIDRGRVASMYPDVADMLPLAQGLKDADLQTGARSNLIRVIEAWHLPSGTNAGDGRHVICISNALCVDEAWDDDDFPITKLDYSPKEIGYFGQGLSEVLASLQTEMNTLLRKIQICMHFLAVPHWLKQSGSGIQFGAFNNQIGSVINYTGTPPELKVWQSVPRECFEHVEWLYKKGFEISGVSQLAASSKIPGYGTMSGAALREYSDVQSDRFQALGKAWKTLRVNLVKRYVKRAEDIAKKHGSYEVTVVKKSANGKPERLETIDWKDIDLKERKFQIMIQPVSKVATDTPGNIQTAQEMVQAGLMAPETFKDLMNFPDLKAEQDLDGAARKLVHKIVFNILDKGKFQAPDPYMDLVYAMKYATLKWNMAVADDMENERTEQLRTWISNVDDLMQEAKAAMAPPMPMGGPPSPGGAPPAGAPPGAPPQPMPIQGAAA